MIFDIEADGLLDEASKIHCLSYVVGGVVKTITSYDDMRNLLTKAKVLIGHNIIRYDIPLLERLLGIKIHAKLIDTLALSWYLYPEKVIHGLEDWGVHYGVPKPKIDDWENLSLEEYIHRCEEDVKINNLLWIDMDKYLHKLYDNPSRIISYLMFKMDCAKEQQEIGWRVDVNLLDNSLEELSKEREEVFNHLFKVMPDVPVYKKATFPAKPYKKSGELSSTGQKWFALLEEHNLPKHFAEPVEYLSGHKPPNPGSSVQVKDWLLSLGWKPKSFKFDGKRKIPQVRIDDDGEKVLCPSVVALEKKEPAISYLSSITTLDHRLSILKAVKENLTGDRVKAEISGLTNTLRFKHKKPCVNLPGVNKKYGEIIRGLFIADEGHVMIGSDKSSLEATTKRHYMFPYDPDYVNEMGKPGFDEHLDLAKQAGEITQEQIEAYNNGDKRYKPIRNKFKPANYACVYGVMAPRLSRDTGLSLKEAQKLIDVYWERNWAVGAAVEALETKVVNGQKWLFNPVSRFWLSLRHEKDKFSTLNQSTGVFCFDTWVGQVRKKGYPINAQFHDEIVSSIRKGLEALAEEDLRDAVRITNEVIKLNVKLDIDVQFGKRYSEIH